MRVNNNLRETPQRRRHPRRLGLWRYGLAIVYFVLGLGTACAQDEKLGEGKAETVAICYGYSCLVQTPVTYSAAQLQSLRDLMQQAGNAAEERQQLALAIGRLYAWAGEQSPIHADVGGNYNDPPLGKMDCIDHSQSTRRLLLLLDQRIGLRWHRVLDEIQSRRWLMIPTHFSAAVVEVVAPPSPSVATPISTPTSAEKNSTTNPAGDVSSTSAAMSEPEEIDESAHIYVVDSWFVNNGEAAIILPLSAWQKGEGPDV